MSLSFAVRYPDSFGSLLMIPTLIRSPLEPLPAADVSPAPSFVSVAPQAASQSTIIVAVNIAKILFFIPFYLPI